MSKTSQTVIHRKEKDVVVSIREIIEAYVLSNSDESCKQIITYALKKTNSFLFSPYSTGC